MATEKNVKLVTSTYNCNYSESKSQSGDRARKTFESIFPCSNCFIPISTQQKLIKSVFAAELFNAGW